MQTPPTPISAAADLVLAPPLAVPTGPVTTIEVSFPGGKRVDARLGDTVIRTDQPLSAGGEGAAPAPFDLFLASIATCAGIYALGFCQARGLPTEGLALRTEVVTDPTSHLPAQVRFLLTTPVGFPEKYRGALARAVESCKVKKTLFAPPTFSIEVKTGAPPCAVE